MSGAVWIALGSALGGLARYGCVNLAAVIAGGAQFPFGTLLVNVVGSFIIGFFAVLTGPGGRFVVAPEARQFVMVGLCGGYTTFSAFSLDTLALMRGGAMGAAVTNIAASVGLCLLAVWLGALAAGALNPVRGG